MLRMEEAILKRINICLASDDGYVNLAMVSICSILENNKKNEIHIYYLDNNISAQRKKELYDLVIKYGQHINFIDVTKEINRLIRSGINSQGEVNSFAAYSRLFAVDLIGDNIDNLIYVDCDTIIQSDLLELLNEDLEGYYFGAVLDMLPSSGKLSIGMNKNDKYFNSGMLLFNVERWRNEDGLGKIMELLKVRVKYPYHDQDILNLAFKEQIKVLSPKYNVMYPVYSFGSDKIKKINSIDNYYLDEELSEALEYPVIIHFLDNILGRPWHSNNINDYGFRYWEKYKRIVFDDMFTYQIKKTSLSLKFKRWLYKNSRKIYYVIYKKQRNKGIKLRCKLVNKND